MDEMEGLEMLDKHDKQINEDILPRVDSLEKWRDVADRELDLLKGEMKEMKLGQQDLKNTVNDVRNTIVAALNSQTSTLDRVLTYSLEIKKTTAETDRTLINANSNVTVARFTSKEKMIIGVCAALFGTGGLAGLITAWPAISNFFTN